MGFFELAGDETRTYFHKNEDGTYDTDYIKVRARLAKRTVNAIVRSLPESLMAEMAGGRTSFTYAEAQETTEALFKALVVGWSLPVEPNIEYYLDLDNIPAQWIDQTLYEHFSSLQLSTKAEQGKP
jgi:hypothetical protein